MPVVPALKARDMPLVGELADRPVPEYSCINGPCLLFRERSLLLYRKGKVVIAVSIANYCISDESAML